MGNSGLYRLFIKDDYQNQVKYHNIEEIPFMSLDRNFKTINDFNADNFLIVNSASKNKDFEKQIYDLKTIALNNKDLKIFLFPTNSNYNEPNNFEEIKNNYGILPENIYLMAKLETKGKYCAPIYKFLYKFIDKKPNTSIYLKDFNKFYFKNNKFNKYFDSQEELKIN